MRTNVLWVYEARGWRTKEYEEDGDEDEDEDEGEGEGEDVRR